jgi:hypothetical protein
MLSWKDLIGKKFHMLTVLSRAPNQGERTMLLCKCDCGNEVVVWMNNLRRGFTKACGCLVGVHWRGKSYVRPDFTAHGYSQTPEYQIWRLMKRRCYNPKNKDYHNYGARGITVCERWKDSPASFIEDMGQRPSAKHSIDRIDSNGNYEPSNCRWATMAEQQNNKRTCVMINGLSMKNYCRENNLDYSRFREAYRQYGYSLEKSIAYATTKRVPCLPKEELSPLEIFDKPEKHDIMVAGGGQEAVG